MDFDQFQHELDKRLVQSLIGEDAYETVGQHETRVNNVPVPILPPIRDPIYDAEQKPDRRRTVPRHKIHVIGSYPRRIESS